MITAFVRRGLRSALVFVVACQLGVVVGALRAQAATISASVVPGSFTQGAVQASLGAGTTYANPTNNLGDWWRATSNLSTTTGTKFAISMTNSNFNNSVNGNATMIAFGNAGGVTLEFARPMVPLAAQKEFGLFTAQALAAGSGGLFNGNMEAAILVSSDNLAWYTLAGTAVATPTSYTATSYQLNAPTMGYDFGTTAKAWTYGSPGTTFANLTLLADANYTTPMPDDNLFNGTASNADRLALKTDASEATYDAVFGTSGGGNWFDISASGLSSVKYVRLNGVNVGGGIRLDAVFANALAVPEPATIVAAWLGSLALAMRRPRRQGRAERRGGR